MKDEDMHGGHDEHKGVHMDEHNHTGRDAHAGQPHPTRGKRSSYSRHAGHDVTDFDEGSGYRSSSPYPYSSFLPQSKSSQALAKPSASRATSTSLSLIHISEPTRLL